MKRIKCVDAGSAVCPCALAESGNCLVCSKLKGGSCNDCHWTGVCIYTLYRQNNRKRVSGRYPIVMPIKTIRDYEPNFRVFVLHASRGFCQSACKPGSFVFAKNTGDSDWFGMPVSVLKSDPEKCELHLGIYSCGPKSSNLINATETMEIRGVYFSALSGLNSIKKDADKNLVYAKGIAVSPLRNLIDSGTIDCAKTQFYIDDTKVGLRFITDYFGDLPAGSVSFREFIFEGFDRRELRQTGEERVNVLALTSPFYADKIEEAAGRSCVRPAKGNMCCGEGICGACTATDKTGNTVRQCKSIT